MKIKGHSLAAIPLAAGVCLAGGSPALGLGMALTSILIDADHVPEYIIWQKFHFKIGDFFSKENGYVTPRVVYPLHGWDVLLLACLVAVWFACPDWVWCLLMAWIYHLLWDQFLNPVGLGFYLFSFRARHGFSRVNLRGYWGIRCPYTPFKLGKGWFE